MSDSDVDQLLLAASQEFEDEELLLAASKAFENENVSMPGPSKADDLRFGAPRSSVDIKEIKDSGVPKKTKANTSWTTSIWREWAIYRSRNLLDDDAAHTLLPDVVRMETDAMA